jgi:hypothetical protein
MLIVAASDVVLVRFSAEVQAGGSNEIQLTWLVAQETNLDYYILKRKMSHQSDFQDIATISLSNGRDELEGRLYSYTDKNVFKNTSAAEPVIYSLYSNVGGIQRYVSQVDVNYSTTTVRRTWGSIKAMFQ